MKKYLVAILWLSVAPLGAQEAPLSTDYLSYLTPQERQTLEQTGEITNSGDRIDGLKLWKGSPFAWMADVQRAEESTMAVEGLFTLPLPAAKDPAERLLKLYNALNAVSTMEGLPYWSATRKEWETFILASYRVKSPSENARLPDLKVDSIPGISSVIVFQKDNKLGDGYSLMTFKIQNGGIWVQIQNLSGYSMGIIPLVDPGKLVTNFYLIPVKDKLVLYGTLRVKTFSFFGLEKSKEESFFNRMKALAAWFKKQAS